MSDNNGKLEREKKQAQVIKAMLNIENIYEYLALEREHNDQIKVKRMYIDIAGDLVAGILLGQVLYWWTPKKDGSLKVSIEHDGKLWIAKGRKEWWEEIRITPKQFDRACQILEERELIETALFKWNGSPTKHVRPNESNILQGVKSILTKGKNRNLPLGKMEIDERGKSILPKGENPTFIAEITSENTQKRTPESESHSHVAPKYIRICTNFHTEEKPDYFKHIKLTQTEFNHLDIDYAADGDRNELWAALEDLDDNIEAEPNNQKWKHSHYAILRKYLNVARRKQLAAY